MCCHDLAILSYDVSCCTGLLLSVFLFGFADCMFVALYVLKNVQKL